MSSCVIVVRSHFTKNASRGVAPTNAPIAEEVVQECSGLLPQHRPQRLPTLDASLRRFIRRSRDDAASDDSTYSASRRTGTYFHSEASASSPISVRAPHTTTPSTGRSAGN